MILGSYSFSILPSIKQSMARYIKQSMARYIRSLAARLVKIFTIVKSFWKCNNLRFKNVIASLSLASKPHLLYCLRKKEITVIGAKCCWIMQEEVMIISFYVNSGHFLKSLCQLWAKYSKISEMDIIILQYDNRLNHWWYAL